MEQLLIRALPAGTLAALDAKAARAGLNREAWLRQQLVALLADVPADEVLLEQIAALQRQALVLVQWELAVRRERRDDEEDMAEGRRILAED